MVVANSDRASPTSASNDRCSHIERNAHLVTNIYFPRVLEPEIRRRRNKMFGPAERFHMRGICAQACIFGTL